ncbi:MAG TPA: peptidase [Mycobacterium sp.]|nr:peptidase [Mycobacterium sp.]
MRRSTTFAGTEPVDTGFTEKLSRRPVLAVALLAQLILAVVLLWTAAPPPPAPEGAQRATPTSTGTVADPVTRLDLPDGRTARLIGLGGAHTAALLDRIAAELPSASAAVTDFWGPEWPREVVIAAAASEHQFRVLAGGSRDIAATTTSQRIMFSPAAADMSPAALRIVLRHELFHYATRSRTAVDAPRWLSEGVADFVGRPPAAVPGPVEAAALAQLPTDVDLDTPGAARSPAYDRAWWFSRYVADRYGTQALRELYLRACGPGHPDVATAVRDTLGAGLDQVVLGWRQWMTG